MEEIEVNEDRPPNDIDVVTFFELPQSETQETFDPKFSRLNDPVSTKKEFYVDAYSHVLGEPTKQYDVEVISYWYSMWAHCRNGVWKGFLQIDLNCEEDRRARKCLSAIISERRQS